MPLKLIFGVLLTLACAVASAQRTERTYDTKLTKRIKTLGVVVASGFQVHVMTTGGLMLRRDGRFTTAHEGTQLADSLYAAISSELDMEQRYEFKRLPILPETARAVVNALWDQRTGRYGKLATELKSVYRECQCDAVLLVADGPGHNPIVDDAHTFGPTWVGKRSFLGGSQIAKSQLRMGLIAVLIDPATGERDGIGEASSRTEPVDASESNWPGEEGPVGEHHWNQMAAYFAQLNPAVRQALYWVGVRPSCALPYFSKKSPAEARDLEPPATLPGTDPAKCQ